MTRICVYIYYDSILVYILYVCTILVSYSVLELINFGWSMTPKAFVHVVRVTPEIRSPLKVSIIADPKKTYNKNQLSGEFFLPQNSMDFWFETVFFFVLKKTNFTLDRSSWMIFLDVEIVRWWRLEILFRLGWDGDDGMGDDCVRKSQ